MRIFTIFFDSDHKNTIPRVTFANVRKKIATSQKLLKLFALRIVPGRQSIEKIIMSQIGLFPILIIVGEA